MLLIICVERLLHIGSHFSLRKWRRQPHFPTKLEAVRWPHFSTKLAAAASFFYKIGGGGCKDLATLLTAVLTWSGVWRLFKYKKRTYDNWRSCQKSLLQRKSKLDVDPQKNNDASPMSTYRCSYVETYLNVDFRSSAQVKIQVKLNFELFKKKIKFFDPYVVASSYS